MAVQEGVLVHLVMCVSVWMIQVRQIWLNEEIQLTQRKQ